MSLALSPTLSRLVPAFYAYSFCCDFVLLYPVYALLFSDTGLSVAQISSLFLIWAASGIVLEVPSGALADAVSRRLLLVVAPLLSAAGFALWTLAPSYPSFAVGFLLWGAASSLQSGAQEALVYDGLAHAGRADAYATVLGRATSIGLAAVMLATALAAPVFAVGGYPAVTAASVAACVLATLAALALPEWRDHVDLPDDGPDLGYLATLRDGVATAWRVPAVRAAVLLVPAVGAVYGALEEYVPLLARETGAGPSTVALMVLLVEAGVAVGGLLSGRAARWPASRVALLLAAAGVLMAAGGVSGSLLGIVAIALAFTVFQLATVLADVRLQQAITGPHRATVTSVAGLGTDLATLAVYGAYAAASGRLTHGAIFAGFAVVYLAVAVAWVGTAPGASSTRSHRSAMIGRGPARLGQAGGRKGAP